MEEPNTTLFGTPSTTNEVSTPEFAEENTSTTRKYPNRKRARVSYKEMELSDVEEASADEDEDNPKPRKRAKQSTSPAKLKKEEIFPFLSLPRELRDMIYKLALADSKGLLIKSSTFLYRRVPNRVSFDPDDADSWMWHTRDMWRRIFHSSSSPGRVDPEPLSSQLLRTGKVILKEGREVLYGQNIAFIDPAALQTFATAVGPENISFLRRVALKDTKYGKSHRVLLRPALNYLGPAQNLRELLLSIHPNDVPHSARSGREVALSVFAQCFDLLETWVRAELTKPEDERKDVTGLFKPCKLLGNERRIVPNVNDGYEVGMDAFRTRLLRLIQDNISHLYKPAAVQ
jgi:hypothetical protein